MRTICSGNVCPGSDFYIPRGAVFIVSSSPYVNIGPRLPFPILGTADHTLSRKTTGYGPPAFHLRWRATRSSAPTHHSFVALSLLGAQSQKDASLYGCARALTCTYLRSSLRLSKPLHTALPSSRNRQYLPTCDAERLCLIGSAWT